MKKLSVSFLVSMVLLWGTAALAVPYLQLDIVDGVYDPVTETTIATTNPFTLQALIDPLSSQYVEGADYYLSIAVFPAWRRLIRRQVWDRLRSMAAPRSMSPAT